MKATSLRWVCGGLLLGGSNLACSFLLDFDELKGENGVLGDAGKSESSEPDSSSTDTDSSSSEALTSTSDGSDPVTEPLLDSGSETSGDGGPTDFTELPDAAAPDAGDAGDAGTGCPDDCDDGDPCTIDQCTPEGCVSQAIECVTEAACMESICSDGACVDVPKLGLEFDDFDETLTGERIFRSELVGAGDRFYRATYGVWDGVPDVRVVSFSRTGQTPLAEFRLSSALPSGQVVMSPAAVVPDTRIGLSLNVYAAVRRPKQSNDEDETAIAGSIARVRLNRELGIVGGQVDLMSTVPNYRHLAEHLGPAAGQPLNGEPFVVWNGCTTRSGAEDLCVETETENGQGGLFIQVGDQGIDPRDPGANFIAEPRVVSGLAAITAGPTPGVIWMSNLAPGVALNTGFVGSEAPNPMLQCNRSPGAGYVLDASRSLANIWATTWSLRAGNSFLTEATALHCQNGACVDLALLPPATECPAEPPPGRLFPGVRSFVVRSLVRPGEPAERIYQVNAIAGLDEDGAVLALLLSRVDLRLPGSSPEQEAPDPSLLIGGVALAQAPVANAPEWPGLATLAPDKLAVSWIEPKASTSSPDVLRVQRYRICFGE